MESQGCITGQDGEVSVANTHKFSYPGYAEMLLGRVEEAIDR